MTELPGSTLVLHGAHGDRADIREAVEELRERGFDIEVRVTWEGGHAAHFAEEAVQAGRRVVAGGGDGTVHEIAGVLARGDGGHQMGIVPLGTANDLAVSASLPVDDVRAALRLAIEHPSPPAIDVLDVGDRTVVNMATAGPATRVTVETPDGLKRALGGLSYAVSGLARISQIEAQEGRVEGPDFVWEGRFLALAVGNGRQAGGGVVLCPDALMDDGLLDVRIIPEGDGAGGLLLDSLLKGRDAALEDASVGHQGAWVEIETAATLDVNLDGQPVEGTSFRFEVQAGAFRLVLPGRSPLLGG